MTTLAELNQCDEDAFVASLGSVFEHSPWVARAVAGQRPFASAQALHDAMLGVIRAQPAQQLAEFLSVHPELAGSQARAGTMTADSISEQGALALDNLGNAENGRWDALNTAYRRKFGFPFILCVRRHTRASALRRFEARLHNEPAAEMRAAVDEIALVSRLRLAARIADHGMPQLHGQLTIQVLDGTRDRPAAEMHVELAEVGPDGRRSLLRSTTTGHDGGTREPLLGGQPLRIGQYELCFHVGDYFRGRGEAGAPVLDVVPVAFTLQEAERHYHVPLEVSPSAYRAKVVAAD
ncbi:OHCU decarboxylase [Rhodoferax koreense]|uniref:2-oxo-4-hydroxy-4-carboxy-5-ureidoimidazoline decarboxylase n=1 Tax=Rhodoferax koreensis TaxID=1842727 RepID=A0A1P8K1F1_9BURK|nr:2-oxo-4-hydroxy-4-carboxy-5-ureidoimidazoline decarboxylase [Rhodoferax koreense]APW39842.1 OHCU decarboxylase [Rhodoferax koreense]